MIKFVSNVAFTLRQPPLSTSTMSTAHKPATEPLSVSLIIKQRQQSRAAAMAPRDGKSRGSSGAPNINDNLNPVIPPLFPTAPRCSPLNREVSLQVLGYKQYCHFFRSNFSRIMVRRENGFFMRRYTDQYRSPLAMKTHLLQRSHEARYPDELGVSGTVRKGSLRKLKRRIEDLPDADVDKPREGSESPQKQKAGGEEEDEEKEENVDDDDIEEDQDEEMDMGTDYAQSYFDNGEGDDDDRDDEDGPIY